MEPKRRPQAAEAAGSSQVFVWGFGGISPKQCPHPLGKRRRSETALYRSKQVASSASSWVMRGTTRFRGFYTQNLTLLRGKHQQEVAYMSAAGVPVGNQIESNSRTIAHPIAISRLQLQTVVELLDAVQEHAPHLPVSMLRTTATHLADCLKVPIERLKIADLVRVGPEFRQYLEQRRFKRNSVRSYSNFLHILLQTAKNLGCQFNDFDVPEPWKEIMDRLAK
jgi:hypothetical protein